MKAYLNKFVQSDFFVPWLIWCLGNGFIIIATHILVMRTALGPIDTHWTHLFIKVWGNWDGGHYTSIATNGYEIIQYAFFPLFPYLIHFLMEIFDISAYTAGVVISRMALLGGLYYLYRLVILELDKGTAQRTLIYLLVYPASFFLFAIYTESLFLFLAISSIFYARSQKWLLASCLATLAFLTRSVGIALFPALLIEYLQQRNLLNIKNVKSAWGKLFSVDFAFIIFSLTAFGVLALFWYRETGNPLQFFNSQQAWIQDAGRLGSGISSPIKAFSNALQKISPFTIDGGYSIILFDFLATTFAWLILIIHCFQTVLAKKNFPLIYYVYCLGILLIPMFQGSLTSMIRYVIPAFPIFMFLGKWGKAAWLNYTYIILGMLIYSNLLLSFLYHSWVA